MIRVGCSRHGRGPEPALRLRLRTIGWYDAPFTLSARLLAESGEVLGRSAVDVEFPAHLPRTELLSTHVYELPLAACPWERPVLVELSAYRWQFFSMICCCR